jgi:hydrogenase maturation factor
LIQSLPTQHPGLILGPGIGEDAAIIDLGGEQLLVAKSDPITFATDEIGYYAVNVCANDLAVTGATPQFYLPTVLLPEAGANAAMAGEIFAQIGRACRALGIVVAGGHSEVTGTVNQPVVAGTMLGLVARTAYVTTSGGRIGDRLLLAGQVPVEGASIIAREKRADLLAQGWTPARLDQAADYLYTPGISVLEPALAAARAGLVSAMHDPTEGGVITGLREMAAAARLGLAVDLDRIPMPGLAQDLCAAFGLDPLGTIASGALLAAASPDQVDALLALWQGMGWPAAIIGQLLSPEEGLSATRSGHPTPFPEFPADEIVKLWG